MAQAGLESPVAMLVFNRPETTRRVFERVRQARPKRLLVVADGPRPSRPSDPEQCAQTRAIFDAVDWDCQVLRNFADANLGCKKRVSSGIDWIFQQTEEAIILEDDCLPDPSFFPFCDELLARYRDDERVMCISGDNFLGGFPRRNDDSYYFSRFLGIWGWASWRRAWRFYDVDLKIWPLVRDQGWLLDATGDAWQAQRLAKDLEMIRTGILNTWDHQWNFASLMHNGLCAMPTVNLVENIGYGLEATHTRPGDERLESVQHEMKFPLKHPQFVLADRQADAHYFQRQHPRMSLPMRVLNKIRWLIQKRLGKP